MTYIVLDFEFNQAFDFVNNCAAKPNPECRFEIIQIGAVKLNENFDIIDNCNFLIKPSIYKKIHPYVEKITSITTESLADKRAFPDVFKDFLNFIYNNNSQNEVILCVWGSSDIKTLYRNLAYYDLAYEPLIIKYIDIQMLATKYFNYSKGSSIGLKNAADLLKLSSDEKKFHDALYDAVFTAKIFKIVKPQNIPIKIFNSSRILNKKSLKKSLSI